MKEMDAGTTITKTKIEKAIEKIKNVEGFEKVKFIILYGSAAERQMTGGSDIDLCIYHDGSPDESSRFRFKVLSELFDETFDVQIFQQLPIYVRVEVLKGKIIYCKDKQFLYEAAIETIKDFEAFKHRFYDYIGEREITHEKKDYQNKDEGDRGEYQIGRREFTRYI